MSSDIDRIGNDCGGIGSVMRFVAVILLLIPIVSQAQVNDRCRQWQRSLTRIAQYHMGPNAPVAFFGAQIQTESACNPKARSHAGAKGLTQFTGPTVKDMRRWYKNYLSRMDPYNPRDAMHAQVLYMNRLRDYVERHNPASNCDGWSMALGSYNAGPGNMNKAVFRAKRSGLSGRTWKAVGQFMPKESRHYVPRINKLHLVFLSAGWGGPSICIKS